MSKLYVPTRRVIYTTLGKLSSFLGFEDYPVFILCYHSISSDGWDFSVSLKEFTKQMKYLNTKYELVSLDKIVDHINGKEIITKPSVAVTFDDGYKDILSTIPLFKSLNAKPSVFIISNIGHENKTELNTDRKFLNKGDLQKLLKNGWSVGSHTRTHPDMSKLKLSEIKDEVTLSKKEIEKYLNIKIKSIAFPKGRYNKIILNIVKKSGYTVALTMNDGKIDQKTDLLEIPRIGVDGTHSFTEFKVLSSRLVVFFRQFLKNNL